MFARTDAIPRLNASNNFDYSDLRTAIEHDALNVMTPWTFRGGIKYFYVATTFSRRCGCCTKRVPFSQAAGSMILHGSLIIVAVKVCRPTNAKVKYVKGHTSPVISIGISSSHCRTCLLPSQGWPKCSCFVQ